MTKLDKIIKEAIKNLIDDPPEHTKELTLSDGSKLASLIVCVWCFSYIIQSWSFCPHCGKKNKKLSKLQRKKAIYKRMEKKFLEVPPEKLSKMLIRSSSKANIF